MATYARALEERLNERYITYETGDAFALNHDVSNPRFPLVTHSRPFPSVLLSWITSPMKPSSPKMRILTAG